MFNRRTAALAVECMEREKADTAARERQRQWPKSIKVKLATSRGVWRVCVEIQDDTNHPPLAMLSPDDARQLAADLLRIANSIPTRGAAIEAATA